MVICVYKTITKFLMARIIIYNISTPGWRFECEDECNKDTHNFFVNGRSIFIN
jgi:hypothetical protein